MKSQKSMRTLKGVFALVFVYLMISCINLINQEMRLQHYLARLTSDLQEVEEENQKLNRDITYYSGKAGMEELARKRLGYYKKGEIPLRVIEVAPASLDGEIR